MFATTASQSPLEAAAFSLAGIHSPREVVAVWNRLPAIRANHCYSFAVDCCFVDDGYLLRPRPGETGGIMLRKDEFVVSRMKEALLADGLEFIGEEMVARAPTGYFVIAAFVSPQRDFHFYRQFDDGSWWHKPGIFPPVTRRSFSNALIKDPRTASPVHGATVYSDFVGFYAVPLGGIRLRDPVDIPPD